MHLGLGGEEVVGLCNLVFRLSTLELVRVEVVVFAGRTVRTRNLFPSQFQPVHVIEPGVVDDLVDASVA